jgi:nucleoside-diphosphate-sugar epimerase
VVNAGQPLRVLVTGGTGGLGRTLVPALQAEGYAVRVTGRNRAIGTALSASGAEFAAADLAEDDLAPLVRDVAIVFHLAARSSPWGDDILFQKANVVATRRLLDAARAAGCARFVHASTPSVFAEPRDRLALTEESPVASVFASAYARTKYEAERLVLAADGGGMRTVALRPRAIVGPHDSVLLPRLLRIARRGALPLPRGGAALIEISDVRDVARAFIAAARSEKACGHAINISGGQPRPVREIALAACGALGVPCRIRSVPVGLLMVAAGLLEALGRIVDREPPVTRYSAMTLAWSQTFDLSGAADLLHWRPQHSPGEAIAHAATGLA